MGTAVPVRIPSGISDAQPMLPNAAGFPIEGLMDFMAENVRVFTTLRSVLMDEKAGILRSDASRLAEGYQTKEAVILKIRDLEERRSALWQEIGACTRRDPAHLTLSDLLEIVPAAHSGGFRTSLSTLSDLLSEVRKINSDIRDLVLGALNLIRGSISLLTGLLDGQGVYQKTGAMGVGIQSGKLLSRAL